jgi:triacylglycerol lipase
MKPIVLAHGFLGFAKFGRVEYFRGVQDHLQKQGCTVFASTVGPKDSVPERASLLESEIRNQFDGQKVHVIAHSMGGLDARFLLSKNGRQQTDLIASLTTVCTPHQGTAVADVALVARDPVKAANDSRIRGLLNASLGSLSPVQNIFESLGHSMTDALNKTESILQNLHRGDPSSLEAYLTGLFDVSDEALKDLTPAGIQARFPAGSEDSTVPCFSFSANATPFRTLSPILALSYELLRSTDGDNDGMVPVTSAKWRNYMGVLSSDHAGAIGWGFVDYMPWYDQMVKNIQDNVPNN